MAVCAEDPWFQDPQRTGHARLRNANRGIAPQLLELLPTHLVPSHGPGGGQLVSRGLTHRLRQCLYGSRLAGCIELQVLPCWLPRAAARSLALSRITPGLQIQGACG
jgi:hypothetical protein